MRDVYAKVLKTMFRNHLISKRKELKLTQEKMAQKLVMDNRSYAYLEHGKNGCSALTLALYLIYFCDDVQVFLDELKSAFENANEDVD